MYSELLQCVWIKWRVAKQHVLELTVDEGQCPDFDGCITMAKGLMPGVNKIYITDGCGNTQEYYRSASQWYER